MELEMDAEPLVPSADVCAVAALCGILSDPTRVRLLYLVGRGERNVTDLCGALGLPQPTVSHHLGLLRRTGVLDCRRDGKQVYYRPGQTVGYDADGTVSMKARGLVLHIGPAPKDVAHAEATRTTTADRAQASRADEQETASAMACV